VPKYLLSSMGFLNYMCKHTKYIKPIDIKSGKFMLSLYELNAKSSFNKHQSPKNIGKNS
jgi:hypothetical protein